MVRFRRFGRVHGRRPRSLIILGVPIGLAVVGLVGVGVGVGGNESLRQISNQGTSGPTPRSRDALALDKMGLTNSEARLLAVRGDRAFYRLSGDCYAVGPAAPAGTYVYGLIMCAPGFPSAERPILDFTTYSATWKHGQPMEQAQRFITRSEGFAADGIEKLAFLGANGERLAEASVLNNTYSFATLPKEGDLAALHAFNADGKVVFSREHSSAPPPTHP